MEAGGRKRTADLQSSWDASDTPARKRNRLLSASEDLSAPLTISASSSPAVFFSRCVDGPAQELHVLRFQKQRILIKLEEQAVQLEGLTRESQKNASKLKVSDTALCSAGRSWDQIDDVMRVLLERLTAQDQTISAAETGVVPPSPSFGGFLDRLLKRPTEDPPSLPGVTEACEVRQRQSVALITAVVEAMMKHRSSYSSLLQRIREQLTADSASNPDAQRLVEENEKLAKEMASAQQTLDMSNGRLRAANVQSTILGDNLRATNSKVEQLQTEVDYLKDLAEKGRNTLAKYRAMVAQQQQTPPPQPTSAPPTSTTPQLMSPPRDGMASPLLPIKKLALKSSEEDLGSQPSPRSSQSQSIWAEEREKLLREVSELRQELEQANLVKSGQSKSSALLANRMQEERKRADVAQSEVMSLRSKETQATDVIKELEQRASMLSQRKTDLERQLDLLQKDLRAAHEKSERLQTEVISLHGKLEQSGSLKDLTKFSDAIQTEMHRLQEELAKERAKTAATRGKDEESYAEEIDAIERAYQDLLKSSQEVNEQLVHRSECNAQLVQERISLEQRYNDLVYEKGKLGVSIQASDLRLHDLTRELGLRDGTLGKMQEDLAQLQQQAMEFDNALVIKRKELEDAQRASTELQEKFLQQETALREAHSRATELQVQLSKVVEERDSLKKKADVVQVPRRVKELEEIVNGFRNKFRCQLCNEREKDSIITRCFHTFCDQCIKESMQKRNRKCPSCGLTFSQSEVHKIFL